MGVSKGLGASGATGGASEGAAFWLRPRRPPLVLGGGVASRSLDKQRQKTLFKTAKDQKRRVVFVRKKLGAEKQNALVVAAEEWRSFSTPT